MILTCLVVVRPIRDRYFTNVQHAKKGMTPELPHFKSHFFINGVSNYPGKINIDNLSSNRNVMLRTVVFYFLEVKANLIRTVFSFNGAPNNKPFNSQTGCNLLFNYEGCKYKILKNIILIKVQS